MVLSCRREGDGRKDAWTVGYLKKKDLKTGIPKGEHSLLLLVKLELNMLLLPFLILMRPGLQTVLLLICLVGHSA